jgi:hypothetical protein
METETSFLPAFRGYERIGQFPLEKNSKFSSFAEAERYAMLGFTGQSSAYSGQIISIEEQGKISVCAIDPNFKLVGITSTTTTDSSTYMEFSYEALNISSGAAKIVLEKGSFLKTLTIQIMSPFYDYKGEICDEAFTVGGPVVNGEVKIQYLGEDEILTSEVGNYVVYFNSLLKEELTEIIVYANPKYHGTHGYTGGHAILKIN